MLLFSHRYVGNVVEIYGFVDLHCGKCHRHTNGTKKLTKVQGPNGAFPGDFNIEIAIRDEHFANAKIPIGTKRFLQRTYEQVKNDLF